MNLGQYLIQPSWKKALDSEFKSPYFIELEKFIAKRQKSHTIYPPMAQIFNALSLPFSKVKVVILGQDPYHGPNQAHGLSFSVPAGVKCPPSLVNIFKELKDDCHIECKHSNLESWMKQGVLLLNSVLTVDKDNAASHQKQGWEIFTDKIIQLLAESEQPLVFILWGNYAQKKAQIVKNPNHLILKSVHPSPLSAHRGFFGSKPFSKTNNFLKKHKLTPIDWQT